MQLFKKYSAKPKSSKEDDTRTRILNAALHLFAHKGFDGTTTKELAAKAQVAEGTLFRHFSNKKAILTEIATKGWVDILTDLLTELSEMGNYKAISQVMRNRMMRMRENSDMMRVCFMEAQFHPDLRDRIQLEVINKMTSVAEAFFETAMDRGVYRRMDPKIVAQVFLGMFAVAGFSKDTLIDSYSSAKELQEMAEGIADIFLNGVLVN